MTNRNYRNGRGFEYRVKQRLEQDGWVVFRSAGSHGCADLVAFKPGERPLWVQCKSGRPIGEAERATLRDLAAAHDVTAVVYGRGMVAEAA